MTDAEQANFDKCPSFRGCSASVCPLYSRVESTYFITGDRQCSKILDFLENKEMPEDLRLAIAESEPKWRAALGDKKLDKWLTARIKFRDRFKDAVSTGGVKV